jgi:hypothetical protein
MDAGVHIMGKGHKQYLLQIEEVIKEIDRYKWIQSEKAGHDIGFALASEEWLRDVSDEWLRHHFVPGKRSARASKKNTRTTKRR